MASSFHGLELLSLTVPSPTAGLKNWEETEENDIDQSILPTAVHPNPYILNPTSRG